MCRVIQDRSCFIGLMTSFMTEYKTTPEKSLFFLLLAYATPEKSRSSTEPVINLRLRKNVFATHLVQSVFFLHQLAHIVKCDEKIKEICRVIQDRSFIGLMTSFMTDPRKSLFFIISLCNTIRTSKQYWLVKLAYPPHSQLQNHLNMSAILPPVHE